MSGTRISVVFATMLAPIFWGSTYIVFTETLPVSHPLLVAALRALPAGILLMALGPGLPRRDKLLPLAIIGLANIGVFFGLLFVAASRLPGGVAATVGSSQPLIVAFLAWPLLARLPHPGQILAALAGLAGVGLLVLDPAASFDAGGIAAAIAGAGSMALGTVLIERWGRIGSPLALTAWQLTLGGMALLPFALYFEGLPPAPTATNLLGISYLVLIGTALSYWLWVRGISHLGADVAFISLLSPLVATLLGAVILGEWFGPVQILGIALIFASTAAGILLSRRRKAPPVVAAPARQAC